MTKSEERRRVPLERCVMCMYYNSSPQGVKCRKREDGPYKSGLGWCSDFADVALRKRGKKK